MTRLRMGKSVHRWEVVNPTFVRLRIFTPFCFGSCIFFFPTHLAPVFPSTNKTDCHDITEILLRVALNTISLTPIMSKDGILYYLIFKPWLWPSALFNKANKIDICELLCHND